MKKTKKIIASRRLLQNPYAYLSGDGGFDVTNSDPQRSESRRLYQNPYAYLGETDVRGHARAAISPGGHRRDSDIARQVRALHLRIWKNRHRIWPEGAPADPVAMLDPEVATRLIGYDYEDAEYLGEHKTTGGAAEIAGTIDYPGKRISVSHRFSPEVRRFTGAHELGHALLHQGNSLHRDRPVDGSAPRREPEEVEADTFATYFLMPEKLVRTYFAQVFGAMPFELTEHTAFALDPSDHFGLMTRCNTLRDLSRVLARATYFNGKHVNSLAARFGVSVETMAIRIEELGLIG